MPRNHMWRWEDDLYSLEIPSWVALNVIHAFSPQTLNLPKWLMFEYLGTTPKKQAHFSKFLECLYHAATWKFKRLLVEGISQKENCHQKRLPLCMGAINEARGTFQKWGYSFKYFPFKEKPICMRGYVMLYLVKSQARAPSCNNGGAQTESKEFTQWAYRTWDPVKKEYPLTPRR